MSRVAIFDYGAGNIFSLKNALERSGAEVKIINDLNDIENSSGLLLPGVGNFDPAMRSIRDPNVPFQESIGESLPVLGICLGMEMYFEQSQEGKERGFAALKGDVILLPDTIKVPHMGWNSLQMQEILWQLQLCDDRFGHSLRSRVCNCSCLLKATGKNVRDLLLKLFQC